MAKRRNGLDLAISHIDQEITIANGQLEVLRAARARLVQQQKPPQPPQPTPKKPSGHPEGGKGI